MSSSGPGHSTPSWNSYARSKLRLKLGTKESLVLLSQHYRVHPDLRIHLVLIDNHAAYLLLRALHSGFDFFIVIAAVDAAKIGRSIQPGYPRDGPGRSQSRTTNSRKLCRQYSSLFLTQVSVIVTQERRRLRNHHTLSFKGRALTHLPKSGTGFVYTRKAARTTVRSQSHSKSARSDICISIALIRPS